MGSAIEAGTSVSLPERRRNNQASVRLRGAFGPARKTFERDQNARHRRGAQPPTSADAARAPASAACKTSSLVSSTELHSTVPVVILQISRNRAALPDRSVLAARFMKSSFMPRSVSRPLSAPEAA
jgi:hypothetical protein